MKPQHVALAVLITAIWGFNFVAVRIGLGSFPPLFMIALRFAGAALPVLFLPRPDVPWPRMILIGLTLFVGQFGFLFVGMANGMPPGLASTALQAQAFFTILVAAAVLREQPTARQIAGMLFALAGLGLIAATVGGDVTAVGLACTLAAALSWAVGNVLLRGIGKVDMLNMIVWLSLVSVPPALALSLAVEGPQTIANALWHAEWSAIGAVLYIIIPTTIFGFGSWGQLLKLYPAGAVASFGLLVPFFGAISAFLVYGEQFGPLRFAGMVLIVAGLAVMVIDLSGFHARWRQGRVRSGRRREARHGVRK
jgi:O-acetylserine/cysteine efflux transporter